MTGPLVSIIIPAHNAEKYLAETLQSALDQSWVNTEIIVIDNGSTDGTLAVATGFEEKGIKVFTQENKGASGARNRGLTEARGEYIQYLDADDLISPDKVASQVALLQNNPGYISTGPTIHFFDSDDVKRKQPEHFWMSEGSNDPFDFLLKLYGGIHIGPQYGGMMAVHSWLSPKSVLDKAGRWNESLSIDDDGEYFCRVILASNGIVYAPGAVSYYRKYVQNISLSGMRSAKGFQSMIDAIGLKYQHLSKTGREKNLVDKIFAGFYAEVAVSAYPKYKTLSDSALQKAKELAPVKPQYKSGLVSNFLIKLFGWRLIRAFNYYRYKL